MRLIDADALTEFLKCLLPKRGMWEIEGDTAKDAICETVSEAIEMVKNMETIQPAKAQLSQEGTTKGTTSDTISKMETVEHLRRVLEATVPNTDYDEGYIDGVEFGISTVSTMPTIQPQSTMGQLNDGARSTDLIDRQQAIDALDCINGVEEVLRSLPPAQPNLQPTCNQLATDTISRQQAIDEIGKAADELYENIKKGATFPQRQWFDGMAHAQSILEDLPPAQPEYRLDEWCHDCKEYDQEHHCCPRFNRVIREALKDAQPEPKEGHWIPHETPDGGEQYECSRCGVLWEFNDGTPEDNEAYFCPKCGSYLGGG